MESGSRSNNQARYSCLINISSHYPESTESWKPSILDCEGTWVLIHTCAYFSKANKFRLVNAKVWIVQVGRIYCVHVSSIQQSLFLSTLPVCGQNRSQAQRGVRKGNNHNSYRIMIKSHTWFLFCIGRGVVQGGKYHM